MADLSPLSDFVRRFDRERFLTTLFAPAKARDDLLALYAFNIEIASVAETVSEPMIGLMRLKWWFDALDGICAGKPPSHHVAVPLSETFRRFGLERRPFEEMIEARSEDLLGEPIADLEALERYADRTAGNLMRLAFAVLGWSGHEVDEIARAGGAATALSGCVRVLPFRRGSGRIPLPEDLCESAEFDRNTLLTSGSGSSGPTGLSGVTRPIVERAAGAVARARRAKDRTPAGVRAAALPILVADHHIASLRRRDCDPFCTPENGGVALMLKLAWASMRRSY